MASFVNYTTILATAVANNATVVVAYQSPDTAATYTLARPSQVMAGQNLWVTPTTATLAYAGSITVTNKSGATWAAGTVITFNAQLAAPDSAGTLTPTPAPTALVNNTGGTVSGTLAVIADAPTANALASINALIVSTTAALRSAGVLT